jgi:pimeloyl-ACP methyl ester carboxylesterase
MKIPKNRNDLGRLATIVGKSIAVLVLVVTISSLLFNAFTQPPAIVPAPYGAYADVNGMHVHYEKWGTTGSPIVLLPGFLESTFVWHTVAPLLAVNHVVYAVDPAGFGYTYAPGKYSLVDQTQLVVGFLHKLHIKNSVIVGHSLGAAIAGSVALLSPSDVQKVLFADGDGLKLDTGPTWLKSLFISSPYFTTLYRMGTHLTALDTYLIRTACGPKCPSLSASETKAWVAPLRQSSEEEAIGSMAKNGIVGLTPQQIKNITVPASIIWGQQDTTAGGSLHEAEINLHNPPVHIIPNAGHLSMIADPVMFAQALLSESVK